MTNYVQISLEDYNELLLENTRLKAAISVKPNWRDLPEVQIDLTTIADIIREKFEVSDFTETHRLTRRRSWYTLSTESTFQAIEQPEEEESL